MIYFILISTHNENKSNLFITESYDPTSHIESTSNNVLSIYQRIFGEEFDLTIAAEKKRSWRFHNSLFLIISIWIFYYISNFSEEGVKNILFEFKFNVSIIIINKLELKTNLKFCLSICIYILYPDNFRNRLLINSFKNAV